ncbi:MAG: hypothetical protein HYV13_03625 [Candidatus Doudnabacteria bacterium]|nr:hypothetical protein [Candidatus Doudnabacteria bacterium]
MLTTEDIKRIIEAEKELFYTKPEMDKKFQKLENSFSSLQTSVDAMTKTFKQYYEEQQIFVKKVQKIEDWIKKAADKLGLGYEA